MSTNTDSLLDHSWIEEHRLLAGSIPTCPEDIRLLHDLGVRSILSLTEESLEFYGLPAELFAELGITTVHQPIPDTFPPETWQVADLLREISYLKGSTPALYIHCHAGYGRTGTVLQLHYLHQGMRLADVQRLLAASRPGCVCVTDAQTRFLWQYEQDLVLRDEPVRPGTTVVEQAGAVPVRYGPHGPEVLVITSSAGDCWLVPKGHIEATETAQETALKEAEEEAGVRGELLADPLGEYTYSKYCARYRVQLFLLRVQDTLEEWDESSIRQRRWVSPGDAARIVSIPSLAKVLRSLPDRWDG